MVFAACWGVVQLAMLGSAARSLRVGTLLLAVGAGVYGCGVLAVIVEYAWTHVRANVTGVPIYQVVATGSYTVDPFVEEIAKVVPLLLLAWGARARLQRGLTDYLLLGAATGAGFGLAEAVMRFGTRAGTAVRMPGGWVLPISLSPPTVPTPVAAVGSWLPAPSGGDGLLSLSVGSGTNLHLAWSALAGLGVGLAVRGRGPVRLLGPLLVVLVGADHAAYNFDAHHPGDTGLGGHFAAPLVAAQPLLWLWPLLALAVAVTLDLRWLRRACGLAPDLRLRREHEGTAPATLRLARYTLLGLPWTPLIIARFTLLRRAALYQVETRHTGRLGGEPARRTRDSRPRCCRAPADRGRARA
jgi:PrsW family intramembrane metalloprotease